VSYTLVAPKVTSSYKADNSGFLDSSDIRAKSSKPYRLPAPYRRQIIRTHSVKLVVRSGPSPGIRPDSGQGLPVSCLTHPSFAAAFDATMNKVHGKIVNALNDESMLAVNYGERARSASMLQTRVLQLYRFSRELRRGNIVSAARELNLSGREPRVQKIRKKYFRFFERSDGSAKRRYRDFGSAFLEFHFGWSPIVHDIHASCETLSNPLQPTRVRVSAVEKIAVDVRLNAQQAFNCGPGIEGYARSTLRGKLTGYGGCEISISNSDAYLANRLGLVNPASVAWELTYFSFLIDWVANVGQFVAQFTDFVGVKVENPYHGYSATATFVSSYRGKWFCQNGQPFFGEDFIKEGTYTERKLGLPSVKLICRLPPRLSLWRAGTAISLLLQKLK